MSSGFGTTGSGTIKYTLVVDDSQAVQKLQSVSQQMTVMGNSTQQATQQMKETPQALDDIKQSADRAQQSQQSFGSSMKSSVLAIAQVATSIVSIVQQYTSLKRAQNQLERAQNVEKGQLISIAKQREKVAEAIENHGKNSEEAKKEIEKLTLMESKHSTQLEKIDLMQESLNQRMIDFAVNIVPTSIGVVAGLAQTFDILKRGRSGTGGIAGTLTMIGRFALPLAALGIAVFAVKTNLFGFRDALDGVGKSIGDALPGLRPLLDAIRNVGIVLGLVPGNAEAAQSALKEFGGGIMKWGKQVGDTLGQIFDSLKQGDINQAINTAKDAVRKLFNITIGQFKVKMFGIDMTIDKAIAAIKAMWINEAKFSGEWVATVQTAKVVFQEFIWPNFRPEAQRGLNLLHADIKAVFENPTLGTLGKFNIDFNKLFSLTFTDLNKENENSAFAKWWRGQSEIWDRQLGIFINDVQLGFKSVSLKVQAFLDSNPIFGGIQILGDGKEQDVLTIQEASEWFNTNVLSPIGYAYGVTKSALQNFIKTNPIFQNVIAGNIMGAISDITGQVREWFGKYIGEPITKAWNNFKSTLVNNPVIQEIKKALTNAIGFLQDLFKTQTAEGAEVKIDFQEIVITADNSKAIKAVDVIAKRINDLSNIKPGISLQNTKAIKITDVVAKRIDSLENIEPQISLQNKQALKAVDVVARRIESLSDIKPKITVRIGTSGPGRPFIEQLI